MMLRINLMALALISFHANAKDDHNLTINQENMSMKCQGSITYSLSFVKENEIIATHITNGTITFSGNDYLKGNNIKFCTDKALDLSADTLYFDSSGCGIKKEKPRQFGFYNRILKRVDLINIQHNGIVSSGRFECKKAE